MITTLFFIQLIAFQIWYVTSSQVKHGTPSGYLITVLRRNKQAYRIAGIALLVLVTVLFIVRLGWMSGISASVVGLMGIGGLAVLLNPFHYVTERGVAALYVFFVVLEFLI